MLIDSFGRTATDLRVSVTGRCNLRCTYCMPAEGLDWLPRPDLLADEELVRLIRVAVTRLGITEVRFTGGEPLLRRGQAFGVDGGPGQVGIIASVTRPFCGAWDRVRLTADGQVRNCLFAREESDLRGLLRSGASDAGLAAAWQRAVLSKLPGHGINDPGFLQPARPMSAIGG